MALLSLAAGLAMAQAVSRRPPRSPGFAPGSVHVGFVVNKVALGQCLLQVLLVSPVNSIRLWLNTSIPSGGMNNRPAAGRSSETKYHPIYRKQHHWQPLLTGMCVRSVHTKTQVGHIMTHLPVLIHRPYSEHRLVVRQLFPGVPESVYTD
jgi:hypothetical protein